METPTSTLVPAFIRLEFGLELEKLQHLRHIVCHRAGRVVVAAAAGNLPPRIACVTTITRLADESGWHAGRVFVTLEASRLNPSEVCQFLLFHLTLFQNSY